MDNIFNYLKLGTHEIISETEFRNLLLNKKELVVKIGFDPTSDKLHLGHYVILKKLRDFQLCGYNIHLIIGDFTASIGDPSGKSAARKSLYIDDVKQNYIYYSEYIFKFLIKDLTYIYFNSTWFNFINISDFIQLLSFSTVAKILERSDFKGRYINNKSISLHEFIYPVLQSYDSVFLHADIEIGGIDQKFNLLLARDLQKFYFQTSQVLIMMPILTGLDGINKMSKSLNNCIFLDEDYYNIFCKVMSLSDDLISQYFIYLGFLNAEEYVDLCYIENNIMFRKMNLAFKIVSCLYNEFLASDAKLKFINRVSKKIVDYDVELVNLYISFDSITLLNLFFMINFVDTVAEFKRAIKSKSIKIDGIVISGRNYVLCLDTVYLVQMGKKKSIKIILKKK